MPKDRQRLTPQQEALAQIAAMSDEDFTNWVAADMRNSAQQMVSATVQSMLAHVQQYEPSPEARLSSLFFAVLTHLAAHPEIDTMSSLKSIVSRVLEAGYTQAQIRDSLKRAFQELARRRTA